MKKTFTILFSLIFVFSSCQTKEKIEDKEDYLRWIGDIEQNNEMDDTEFKACMGDENILQYFHLQEGPMYYGEKPGIQNTFNTKYKPVTGNNQNGYIRIRFVVNCEGKAGRFRILQSDYDYNEIQFDESIVDQLLEITKGMENWEILYGNEKIPIDYYLYLIFKINDGQITEILP